MLLKETTIGRAVVSAVGLVLTTAALVSAGNEDSSTDKTYALIVSGISRDPSDRLARRQALETLSVYLRGPAALGPEQVSVLIGDDSGLTDPNVLATAENVKTAVASIASVIRAQDRFVFCYLGLANAVSDTLRFNLPGPDVTHEALAGWLGGIKSKTQVVVLDCPCAALAAKALARPGRISVYASTATQAYSTGFTGRFVPALTQMENDTNQDGSVSLLEAFTATTKETEQWYRRIQCLPTETPSLEDNGDGVPSERPWRYSMDGGDGARSATFFFAAAQQ